MPAMTSSTLHVKNNGTTKRKATNSVKGKKKQLPVYEAHNYDDILGDVPDRDEQEEELERLVFGGSEDILEELNQDDLRKKRKKKKKLTHDSSQAIADFGIIDVGNSYENEDNSHESQDEKSTKKAAWNDEDDDNYLVEDKAVTLKNCHRSITLKGQENYKEYVQEKFIKVMGNPSWASLTKKKDSDESEEDLEDEFLRSTGSFLVQSSSLPKETVNIRKCENLNEEESTGVIKSVEFHPTSKVALIAGYNRTATLHQVDGKFNPKIQSVHFERFPIHTAHFTTDGNEFVVGSKKYGHLFYYDMMAGKIVRIPWERDMDQMNVGKFEVSPDGKLIAIYGKFGNIHLITAKTKEWIGSLKMNGELRSIAFNHNGSQMFTHGDAGQVYVWDMKSRTCIHKFTDEGCVTGTSLAVSPNHKYLAAGSDCGIVNVYEMSSVLSTPDPKPLKMLTNLTTEVTSLKFNCTSEILAMASPLNRNSLRLVHFPSISVFPNFPVQNIDFRFINSLDMSLNSGYLAFGNNIGKAYLYRLKHYGNY